MVMKNAAKRTGRLVVLLMLVLCVSLQAGLACCSLAPAEFIKTYGWVGELEKNGKLIHVLAYENVAYNRSGSGNAMILPIPAVEGTLTSKNLLEGHQFRSVVKDLYNSSRGPIEKAVDDVLDQLNSLSAAAAAGGPESKAAEPVRVEVFSRGSYTVVLSNSATAIPEALSKVPADKRPVLNKEIFDAYAKWYPGWSFALCCFADAVDRPEPLIWWYEPKNPDKLFFPALDAHTGGPPVLNSVVDVDHRLVLSSHKLSNLLADTWISPVHRVKFSEPRKILTDETKSYIPEFVVGDRFSTPLVQGDFEFSVPEIRMGIVRPVRAQPDATPSPGIGYRTAELLSRDNSMLLKVPIAYLLASVFLLFSLTWLPGFVMLVLTPLMAIAMGWLAFTKSHEVSLMTAMLSVETMLVVFALFLPVIWATRKDPSAMKRYGLATLLLVIAAYALPGYSSSWIIVAWPIVLLFAYIHVRRKKDAEPAPVVEES